MKHADYSSQKGSSPKIRRYLSETDTLQRASLQLRKWFGCSVYLDGQIHYATTVLGFKATMATSPTQRFPKENYQRTKSLI
ncbi:hypothetical protein NDN17_08520 [Shewanella algae]|uniref:hypothetical protein n=1 Tax=Shewanella algae TaxID=38313 RepID=UPI0020360FF2|nr:hypothetical protein [Shewanella algae]MCM2528562.1 hypothetical protein [Shewanella algae]